MKKKNARSPKKFMGLKKLLIRKKAAPVVSKNYLTLLRVVLGIIALGAAYVFWVNADTNPDRAMVQLRAASQVLVVLTFLFLIVLLPSLLPKQRDLVEKSIIGVLGFFILANSLPFITRVMNSTLPELANVSGLSVLHLIVQHALNIVLIPTILCLALLSTIHRASDSTKKVNEPGYWIVLLVALGGLAYISLTITWTLA
jgi:cytochrome bd-type quinol oxidase subunit 2